MLSENSRRIPPHLIALHLLLVSYPLFAKAWQIANRQRVLSIEERPDYFFPLPYMAGTGAIYQFESHTIVISESGNLRQKMNALIFETLNALQRRSPQEITRLALQRQIHREEYTVLMEWIENRSDHWINRIFSLPYRVSFSECWRRVNTPPRRGASSHADHFRRQWDDQIALTYLGISGDQPAESKTNG